MSEYELYVTVEYDEVSIDTSHKAQTAVLAVANIVDWSGESPTHYTKTAINQPIGGHRVVVAVGETGCDYADKQDESHCDRVVGITTNAAAQNGICIIAQKGDITHSSWNWQVNEPVFVGSNGLLTQTPPSTGFHQQFAVALTATTLYIDIHPAILLEN